jgi:hypothetical protein
MCLCAHFAYGRRWTLAEREFFQRLKKVPFFGLIFLIFDVEKVPFFGLIFFLKFYFGGGGRERNQSSFNQQVAICLIDFLP